MEIFKKKEPQVFERPETPQIPEKLKEETGVVVHEATPPPPIREGETELLTSPEGQKLKIELPRGEEELRRMAGGSPDDASRWFGEDWLRRLKMALARHKK